MSASATTTSLLMRKSRSAPAVARPGINAMADGLASSFIGLVSHIFVPSFVFSDSSSVTFLLTGIIARFRLMFADPKFAGLMRYHLERRQYSYANFDLDLMTDLMDGTSWKEKVLDQPRMAADGRNAVCILCGDGVCPFNMLRNKKTMYVFQRSRIRFDP